MDKMPRNKVQQKKIQGGKNSNQSIPHNVSSPKLGVQIPQNLSGQISVKMIRVWGICARFEKETHTGNASWDNWTTDISLSRRGRNYLIPEVLMARKRSLGPH